MEAHSVDIPDRYSIEGLLGEGAAATTYRAYDGVLDRRVTLKVLRRPDGDDDAVTARFAREARAAAAVDHPNVVDVYDYGSHQGSLHLVLQYVPGRNLKQLLAETGPLPARDAVRIVDQVLAGLGAIHAAGLVHRDVKPQNVIVGDDGVARVTDFGIAVAPTDTRLTTHGAVWGTPAYMAPEQAGGDAVSPRTDLYAVGVMLFEMLTGRLPFAADNAIAVALAHIHNPPPSWRQFAPRADVPPAVEAAMLRALAKNPADRFGDAAAMTAALNGPAPTVVASDPTVQL
ncbi:MAG: serine/threonine-protein kinase, partial [Thermomicrobiales bacterium]